MASTNHLPLLDLSRNIDPATITNIREALLRYGAFRLWAPDLKKAYSLELRQNALEFFQLPLEVKAKTKGFTGFDSELIRGDTPIPKESMYFFRRSDRQGNPPPSALHNSVVMLHDKWKPLKDTIFSIMSNNILDTRVPLTGTPLLDNESLGINFYDPQQLSDDTSEYNPAHMDTGTLILLFRDDSAYDGLEIADLRSTSKLGSKNVGEEAVFLPVPANPDEVIVLAGTRLQRLFGKDKVRPCVHRVRGPALERRCKEGVRLSFTIACALSPVQVNNN